MASGTEQPANQGSVARTIYREEKARAAKRGARVLRETRRPRPTMTEDQLEHNARELESVSDGYVQKCGATISANASRNHEKALQSPARQAAL